MNRERRSRTASHISAVAVVVVGVLVTLVVAFASGREKAGQGRMAGVTPPDANRLARIHAELAGGRIDLAAFEWRDAYAVALASRQWASLVAVGDAAVAIGDASGTRIGWTTKAQDCYRGALFRARSQASLEGVLSATQAFARLGDSGGAAQGIALAWSFALDPTSLARVHDVASRVDQRAFATADSTPDRF
jgi:hypothetical protein